jgi:prevent-host-death family protein
LANKIGQTCKFAMKSRHPRKLAEHAPAFSRGGANPREIPASEAKARLSELLDAVERGETIAITRHGRRIARLTPDAQHRLQEIKQAMENIEALRKEIRKRSGLITAEEIVSSIHEGHKI